MNHPASIQNRFGEAHASGEGLAFQAGVITGTVNIDRRPKQITFPKVLYDATYDAANKGHMPTCLPGTRVGVLKEIQEWVDGDSPKGLYWLNGMAGTGKSTIALTLAKIYKRAEEKTVRLAATFFFSRGGGDLASASRFAATIAIQLAEVSPELWKLVEDAVESCPRLDSLSIQEQWHILILQPLSRLHQDATANSIRLLLVIDALDECSGEEDVAVLIQCLEMITRIEGVRCRVFLTSRPDRPIKAGLRKSTSHSRENLVLHDIEKSIVDRDLALFYWDQLSGLKTRMALTEDVVSESMIQSLVERSHKLFIHASTVCRFVKDGGYLAVDRLKHLVTLEKSANAEKGLDAMYTTVLEYSFSSVTSQLDLPEVEKLHTLFQHVIGAIVVMFDAVTLADLAYFLNETKDKVSMALSALHSVIDVPDHDQKPVRILHPSFRDFLLDPQRCIKSSYGIVGDVIHGILLARCFDIMMTQLKRNPMEVAGPGTKRRDIPIETINARLRMPVQYASIYWINHFYKADTKSRTTVPLLRFLEKKILFWLEVLAWTGKLHKGMTAISDLNTFISEQLTPRKKSWISNSSNISKSEWGTPIREMLQDISLFMRNGSSIVEEVPLQVYGLPIALSPRGSQVRITSYEELPKWVLNKPCTPEAWSQSARSISLFHPDYIWAIAISYDGSLLATVCEDKMIRVWNAITGTEKLILESNFPSYGGIAFSPDGDLVASVADDIVSIWEIGSTAGSRLRPNLQLHGRKATSMPRAYAEKCVFSPDGTLLAACHGNNEILVWQLALTDCVKFRLEAVGLVEKLFFSPDGRMLIQVTTTSTILHDGKPLFRASKPHNSWDMRSGSDLGSQATFIGTPLACSSDGRYVTIKRVKGSFKMLLCDAHRGSGYQKRLLASDYPQAAVFPPDGGEPLIASLQNGSLLLWNPDTYSQPRILDDDAHSICDVAFSPNGKSVFGSDRRGGVVKIWNFENVTQETSRSLGIIRGCESLTRKWRRATEAISNIAHTHTLTADMVWRTAANFPLRSPDGGMLATVNRDNSVTIWDSTTGQQTARFAIGREIFSPVFSPDSKLFAILTERGIQLWETETGEKRGFLSEELDKSNIRKIRDKVSEVVNLGIHFSPKGRYVGFQFPSTILETWRIPNPWDFTSESWDITFKAWEIKGAKKVSKFKIPNSLHKADSIQFSPNEELYGICVSTDSKVQIRTFPDGKIKCERNIGYRCYLKYMKFTPDSRTACVFLQSACLVWDLEKDEVQELTIPSNSFSLECFSDDARLLAMAIGNTIEVYDIMDCVFCYRIEVGLPLTTVRFDSSCTHLITNRGSVRLPGAEMPTSPQLFVTESWIQEDGEDILAIPSAYRNKYVSVHGHTVTFFDPQHGPVFVRLDKGRKTMIA